MPEAQAREGACHCGAVTFEADVDLSSVITCNCSICEMKGLTLTFAPASRFRLATGEADLTEYRFNTMKIGHEFCRVCGVQSFARAAGPDGTPMVAINVRCLKEIDLGALEPAKIDGRSL